jgi:hypothetical protein
MCEGSTNRTAVYGSPELFSIYRRCYPVIKASADDRVQTGERLPRDWKQNDSCQWEHAVLATMSTLCTGSNATVLGIKPRVLVLCPLGDGLIREVPKDTGLLIILQKCRRAEEWARYHHARSITVAVQV